MKIIIERLGNLYLSSWLMYYTGFITPKSNQQRNNYSFIDNTLAWLALLLSTSDNGKYMGEKICYAQNENDGR